MWLDCDVVLFWVLYWLCDNDPYSINLLCNVLVDTLALRAFFHLVFLLVDFVLIIFRSFLTKTRPSCVDVARGLSAWTKCFALLRFMTFLEIFETVDYEHVGVFGTSVCDFSCFSRLTIAFLVFKYNYLTDAKLSGAII